MDQQQLLDSWRQFRLTAKNFYQLRDTYTARYAYRGAIYGHPSTHATVHFECLPADSLTFTSMARWPSCLSRDYCTKLESAIGYAILEVLLTASIYPYQGCALTLTEIDWDDVASSEVAFYKATKLGMQELIAKGKWQLRTHTSVLPRP